MFEQVSEILNSLKLKLQQRINHLGVETIPAVCRLFDDFGNTEHIDGKISIVDFRAGLTRLGVRRVSCFLSSTLYLFSFYLAPLPP